ncbi:hypothetical protein [uncultured Pseudomonas sp.]|uniref:hypothetical protein n=1 Tax=uncultured Pseudomonas sp. TaxID=114707 RepID=UPI0030D8540C
MEKLVHWSAALCMTLPLAALAGTLSDETNKFNGVRTVIWNSIPSESGSFALTAAVGMPEDQSRRFYSVNLITYGDSWEFDKCNHTYWMIDGQRASDLRTRYERDSSGSAAIERLYLEDADKVIPRLAAAKKVEFQVCGEDHEVSDSDLDGLRKLMQALN